MNLKLTNVIIILLIISQAAQVQNTRSYIVFFTLLCERSAKRDMGHMLLPNDRIVTLALQHMQVLCYNGLRFEFIKVCMGTQRFCRKNQFCLYFVNKIYLPCCCVVFFLFASSSGRSNAILASYRSVGFHC